MVKLILIRIINFYFKIFNYFFADNETVIIYSLDENFINYISSKIVDYSNNQKTIIVLRNFNILNCFLKSNVIVDSHLIIGTKSAILSLNQKNYFLSVYNDPWIAWKISDLLNSINLFNVRDIETNSKDVIDKFILNCKKEHKDKVIVLGTGPSISKLEISNYNQFLSIVCNTFVKNKDAFNQLKPDLLVATDAAVYLGNSLTSKMFYLELNLRFQEFDFLFVYPIGLHLVVKKNIDKEYHKNLVPISNSSNESFLTMVNEFKLNSLGNTFNTIMMPLACYLSKEIYLAGFDGVSKNNKFKDNSVIWQHNHNFSFKDILIDLNRSEFAFQKFHKHLSDNNLYEKEYFGDKLETQLLEIEKNGYKAVNLTDSNHLSLNKRNIKI